MNITKVLGFLVLLSRMILERKNRMGYSKHLAFYNIFTSNFQINLKYGMLDFLRQQHDTCTACGGTMILEFAALSRLTGKAIYEEKARKAMDFLWAQRHRGSDLMGTVLNVHSGDWIRRGNNEQILIIYI